MGNKGIFMSESTKLGSMYPSKVPY